MKTDRLNDVLGDMASEINEDFYLRVVREYQGKYNDLRSREWRNFVDARVKALWWIFIERN